MFHLRDDVFVFGGQPSVTYVEREQLHVERNLARAIATPNQIVSLAGATKTGKTVICRKVLGDRDFVWIDGGQIGSADDLWKRVFSELAMPYETSVTTGTDKSFSLGLNKIVTAAGSRLRRSSTTEVRHAESMGDAIKFLLEDKIALVVDDFHYMDSQTRTIFMRNIKGSVYGGLKVILLSATHRAFDAITAEPELTGRFTAITLPNWSRDDLQKIPELGFTALRVDCDLTTVRNLAIEAQESPFLMQQFCWEMCYDSGIDKTNIMRRRIQDDYNQEAMFVRLAENAGLP